MNRVGGKNDTFREHILSEIAIGVYRGGSGCLPNVSSGALPG